MTEAELVPQPPAEVQVLDQRSRSLYQRISELKLVDSSTVDLAAGLMAQVKTLVNMIEERFEPHIRRAYETHKGLCADKKRALEVLFDAERLAKDKIGFYFAEAERSGQKPKVDGLIVSDEWTGEVIDASKLPRRFLVPDLDKLKEHTRLYKEATKIPGWKVNKTKRVAQRI